MDTRSVSAKDQNAFLRVAVESGVDEAVARHGSILSADEAVALRQLSKQELEALLRINDRITDIRSSQVADWTCVNTVC